MSECGRLASLPRLVRGLSAVLAFLSIAALIRESNAKSNTKSIFKISKKCDYRLELKSYSNQIDFDALHVHIIFISIQFCIFHYY